jgi:tRNA(Ile)-lysidine synthase
VSKRRPSIVTQLQRSLPVGARVLVAVSGGRDSAVLLDALHRVRRLLQLHLEVCHIDHRLRAGSAKDALFVQRQSLKYGIVCHVVRLGPRPPGSNMEAWARAERYATFARLIEKQRLTFVVTAHNANDVAETLLIRLLANKEANSIDKLDPSRGCLRPLLGVTRAQIDQYAQEHEVEFIDDPSNTDTRLVRNRIRHKLLPMLQHEFDPAIVWSLAQRATSLDADCDALQSLADSEVRALGELQLQNRAWLKRVCARLSGLPGALQWRVVERIFEPLVGFALGERRSVAALVLFSGECPQVQLTHGVLVRRGSSGLEVVHTVPPAA